MTRSITSSSSMMRGTWSQSRRCGLSEAGRADAGGGGFAPGGAVGAAVGLGAGHLTSLPLDARQHEEFFLTAAQSLFGIGLLLRFRLSLAGAAALAILFIVQVTLAVIWQSDEPRIVNTLTWLAWGYLVLAAILFLTNLQALAALFSRTGRRDGQRG